MIWSVQHSNPIHQETTLEQPTTAFALPKVKARYDHYIGGEWVAPSSGEYFDNISPIDGKAWCQAARGNSASSFSRRCWKRSDGAGRYAESPTFAHNE